MSLRDQSNFRKEFKHIVWLKGELTDIRQRIEKLTRFDRDGSHNNAIKKAINEKVLLNETFKDKLNGKTYEDWLVFSKKLSAATSKMNKHFNSYQKAVTELNNLKF